MPAWPKRGRSPSGSASCHRAPLIPRDSVAQNQRERILHATAELVAERGYQKTTIEQIARPRGSPSPPSTSISRAKRHASSPPSTRASRPPARSSPSWSTPSQDWTDQIAGRPGGLSRDGRHRDAARHASASSSRQAAGARGARPLPVDAGERRAEAARGPRPEPAPIASRRGSRWRSPAASAWLVHQRLVAGKGGEIKALLPEMLQIALTPYVGEVEAARAADAARARMAA